MSNNKLRQQLEEAQATNRRLMEDVHQLTAGWNETKQKLREREAHWQESFEVRGEGKGVGREGREGIHLLATVYKETWLKLREREAWRV